MYVQDVLVLSCTRGHQLRATPKYGLASQLWPLRRKTQ